MTNQDIILTTVLKCGTEDLHILDDVQYDLSEIVDDLIDEGIRPTLNAITSMVFYTAAMDLAYHIKEQISELEQNERSNEEDKELNALRKLDTSKDIGWYCNCLDTSVYFVQNEAVYKKYIPEKIKEIEEQTGFYFS